MNLITNKAKVFNRSLSTKSHFALSGNRFSRSAIKRSDLTIRMYYEYLRTSSLNGLSLFVTLTYNDEHLPRFLGHPVHNHDDIRRITNLIKVRCKRQKIGFSYVIVPEFGEGGLTHYYRGKRGYGHNPHYHCVFHFTPLGGEGEFLPDYIYFQKLIAHYWQGNINNTLRKETDLKRYKQFKFGIVNFGRNNGIVYGPQAFQYLSKYVVKDYTVNSRYCIIAKSINEYCNNYIDELKSISGQDRYNALYDITCPNHELSMSQFLNYLYQEKHDYLHLQLRRYLPIVHTSHGYGDYALQFIDNDDMITLPCESEKIHISGYLYRKRYYDIIKQEYNGVKQYVYKLSEQGIKQKLNNLQKNIEFKHNQLTQCITEYYNNQEFRDFVYSKSRKSLDITKNLYKYLYKASIFINVYAFRPCIFLDRPLDIEKDYLCFLYEDSSKVTLFDSVNTSYLQHEFFKDIPLMRILHVYYNYLDFVIQKNEKDYNHKLKIKIANGI
ncbi:replication initiator protein [Capybara microvirus Cap1_SP_118]|nr:replication initiator protein [Capybara microvirus Cap1_SP_118]